MKRILFIALITITSASLAFGQGRGRAGRSPVRRQAGAGVEQQLRNLERQWRDALTRRDAAVLGRLMADDYTTTNPEGMIASRAETLESAASGGFALQPATPDETRVRVYGETALVSGRALWNGRDEIRFAELWVRRPAGWQLVSWQATPLSKLAKFLTGGHIVTTSSGLRYIDLVAGTGASPRTGQNVTVNYLGVLEDGTKFDSSYERGQPFVFPIGAGRVIKGWDEGVMSMKIGGKRRLIIPPDLAYGARGAGGVIPPNATLVFEVELLEVK